MFECCILFFTKYGQKNLNLQTNICKYFFYKFCFLVTFIFVNLPIDIVYICFRLLKFTFDSNSYRWITVQIFLTFNTRLLAFAEMEIANGDSDAIPCTSFNDPDTVELFGELFLLYLFSFRFLFLLPTQSTPQVRYQVFGFGIWRI